MLTAQLKGMDKVLSLFQRFRKGHKDKVATILTKYGGMMQQEARKDHRFTTRTGNLERAISFKVDKERSTLSFYMDDTFLMSGGYNYGWIQHDGSGLGYKKSKMFPKITPKLKTGGIKADHFMVRAWDKYEKQMTKEVRKAILEFWK